MGGSQGDSVMDVGLYIRSATRVVLSTEQLRVKNKCAVASAQDDVSRYYEVLRKELRSLGRYFNA